VLVRIGSGRSQARKMAEVGSGSDDTHTVRGATPRYKSTRSHIPVKQYTKKDACWSSDDTVRLLGGLSHGIRRRLSKKIPNTGALTQIGYA